MKRPSFQFYAYDWQGNSNLKRCTHEEKGIWMDIMCLMHDQEEYGIIRWPLKEIAQAVGASIGKIKSLVLKGIMKGGDTGCEEYIYIPRSGRKDGTPVVLIPKQSTTVWYSSRMVRDEYVRQNAGASTRFQSKTENNSHPTSKNNDNERAKLRQKVLAKTEGKCFHCKCVLPEYWEIDHLIPRSKGGRHSFNNLVPSCKGCNQDKSDTLPEDWRSPCHSPSHRVGEGKDEDKGDGSTSSSSSSNTTDDDYTQVHDIFTSLEKIINSPTPLFSAPIQAWLNWGADYNQDILPVAERWKKKNPKKAMNSLEWLNDDIAKSIQQRSKPMPEVTVKPVFFKPEKPTEPRKGAMQSW